MLNHHENPHVLHEGCEEPVSYFTAHMPQGRDRVLLDGEWNFALFNTYKDAFYSRNMTDFKDTIPVPSTWQIMGFDTPMYSNVNYPFPIDPPYVPLENLTGLYQTNFELTAEDLKSEVFLKFNGVDSCFYLYINGEYAGYSQVSHSTSTFRINDKVKVGSNDIRVLVLKWCDGSYFECQDKFRESGIFRHVELIFRPTTYIRDFHIHQGLNKALTRADVSVDLDVQLADASAFELTGTLFDAEGHQIAEGTAYPIANSADDQTPAYNYRLELNVKKPTLWNAENPYLYKLILTTPYEEIRESIGFRKIDIRRGIFYLNNVPIKMKGVNYHDSSPYTGAALSEAQAIEDLTLMKQANINAIRTSHYPKPDWFYPLCDEMGFYIIDEADQETHGMSRLRRPHSNVGYRNQLMVDPEYLESIMDRCELLFERDKNRPCVLIWSMGNESGYGPNLVECAKYLHRVDKERIVHYENEAWNENCIYDTTVLDLMSRMYAEPEWVAKYCETNPKRHRKPFIQCEYCHAMGNGPGDLEENVSQLYLYDHYCGAFVWEWCDHAVYEGKINGKDAFTYGGDHGDYPNDNNFCMDGLVFPDRRVHTGYKEYSNVLRPLRLSFFNMKEGYFVVRNMLDFSDIKDVCTVEYEVKKAGVTLSKGRVKPFSLLPRDSYSIYINDSHLEEPGVYVILTYKSIADKRVMGFDQAMEELPMLLPEDKKPAAKTSVTAPTFKIEDEKDQIVITGADFRYVLNMSIGTFSSLEKDGEELMDKPMGFNIMRAYIDNDRNIHHDWDSLNLPRVQFRTYSVDCKDTKDSQGAAAVEIRVHGRIAPICKGKLVDMEYTWTINASGTINLDMKATRTPGYVFLPRFGLRMFLKKDFTDVDYFGYGPHESYIDKHRSCILDRYTNKVKGMNEDYVRPQETGSRFGCHYMMLSTAKKAALKKAHCITVTGTAPFSFNTSEYTQEDMLSAEHNFELKKCGSTVLCVDYKLSGCGSNSCGPVLPAEYQLCEDEILWNITIQID